MTTQVGMMTTTGIMMPTAKELQKLKAGGFQDRNFMDIVKTAVKALNTKTR